MSSKQLWEVIFDVKNKGTKENETIEIKDEKDALLVIETIEESNVEKIVVVVMTSLPHSFGIDLVPPSSRGIELK